MNLVCLCDMKHNLSLARTQASLFFIPVLEFALLLTSSCCLLVFLSSCLPFFSHTFCAPPFFFFFAQHVVRRTYWCICACVCVCLWTKSRIYADVYSHVSRRSRQLNYKKRTIIPITADVYWSMILKKKKSEEISALEKRTVCCYYLSAYLFSLLFLLFYLFASSTIKWRPHSYCTLKRAPSFFRLSHVMTRKCGM